MAIVCFSVSALTRPEALLSGLLRNHASMDHEPVNFLPRRTVEVRSIVEHGGLDANGQTVFVLHAVGKWDRYRIGTEFPLADLCSLAQRRESRIRVR